MGFTITAAGEHGNAHFPNRAYAFLKNKTEWGWIEYGGEQRWESRISRSWNPREEHQICFVSRANRARKRGSWSCSHRPSFSKTFMAFFGVGQRNLDHLRHLLFRLGNGLRTPKARDFYFKQFLPAAAAAKLLQSCPTLCDPMDCSPPGSAVPGILQARTPEWVAISFQCMKV